MSGHTLCSPVVLGLACWWLSLVWLGAGASGGCAPAKSKSCALVSEWPRGRWCFWRLCSWRWCFSLACGFWVSFRFPLRGPQHRVGGPPGCERCGGSDGWRSPVPRGDKGARLPSVNHRLLGPPTRPEVRQDPRPLLLRDLHGEPRRPRDTDSTTLTTSREPSADTHPRVAGLRIDPRCLR